MAWVKSFAYSIFANLMMLTIPNHVQRHVLLPQVWEALVVVAYSAVQMEIRTSTVPRSKLRP